MAKDSRDIFVPVNCRKQRKCHWITTGNVSFKKKIPQLQVTPKHKSLHTKAISVYKNASILNRTRKYSTS